MTPLDNKMAVRIAALLAKAESTDSTAEAETLTAKAEELMVKYSIDQAVIDARREGSNKPEAIIVKTIFFTGSYEAGYVMMAFNVVSGLGSVRCLVQANAYDHATQKKGKRLHVIGFESDVEQAELLIRSLQLQALVAMKEWWGKQDSYLMSGSEGWRTRRQFITSFGAGAGERIKSMKLRVVEEAVASEPGTALVLVNRDKQVADVAKQMSGGRSSRGPQGGGYAAASAGRSAGRNANTGGSQLGGTSRGITS